MRKYFLRRDMKDLAVPPFAYLPLSGSLDPFMQILRTLPTEGYAFSTKARCPALMLFELEVHPRAVDVGNFLCCELERYEEGQVINRDISIKNGSSSTWETDDEINNNSTDSMEEKETHARLPSALGLQSSAVVTWKPEGTGIARLEAMGLKCTPAVTQRPSLAGNSNDAKDAAAAAAGLASNGSSSSHSNNTSSTASSSSADHSHNSNTVTGAVADTSSQRATTTCDRR